MTWRHHARRPRGSHPSRLAPAKSSRLTTRLSANDIRLDYHSGCARRDRAARRARREHHEPRGPVAATGGCSPLGSPPPPPASPASPRGSRASRRCGLAIRSATARDPSCSSGSAPAGRGVLPGKPQQLSSVIAGPVTIREALPGSADRLRRAGAVDKLAQLSGAGPPCLRPRSSRPPRPGPRRTSRLSYVTTGLPNGSWYISDMEHPSTSGYRRLMNTSAARAHRSTSCRRQHVRGSARWRARPRLGDLRGELAHVDVGRIVGPGDHVPSSARPESGSSARRSITSATWIAWLHGAERHQRYPVVVGLVPWRPYRDG